MRTGNGGIEPGIYCPLNEMQVLVLNGWAHVQISTLRLYDEHDLPSTRHRRTRLTNVRRQGINVFSTAGLHLGDAALAHFLSVFPLLHIRNLFPQ